MTRQINTPADFTSWKTVAAERIDPRSERILSLATELASERGLDLYDLHPDNRRVVLNAATERVDAQIAEQQRRRAVELANQTNATYDRCQQLMAEIRLSAGIDQDDDPEPTAEGRSEFIRHYRAQSGI